MSERFEIEIKRDVNSINANLQVLTDQIATLAVELNRLIPMVERSQQVAERNAATLAEHSKIAAEQAKTVAEQSKTVAEQAKIAAEQSKTVAEQTRIAAEQAHTVSELVGMVNRLLAERRA